jgi:hypothetical protein
MVYKSFISTGIHKLDEQIQLYEKEAVRKGINFDIYVNMSIADALKEREILQIDFMQLIEYHIRSAFYAIEKSKRNNGNILLVVGCVNEVLQLEIYDDGILDAERIIIKFDKYEKKDATNENNISNVIECLKRYNASYRLIEYEEKSGFTNGICIIWNYQNEICLEAL